MSGARGTATFHAQAVVCAGGGSRSAQAVRFADPLLQNFRSESGLGSRLPDCLLFRFLSAASGF